MLRNISYSLGRTKAGTVLSKINHKSFWLSRIYRFFVYILLLDLTFIFLYPFMHMLVTSFMSDKDLVDITVKWIPNEFRYQNYLIAYNFLKVPLGLKNSIIQTALPVLGHILSCSFIAYGFARYKFPGRGFMFVLVLLSFIIPAQTFIVPMYINFVSIGWSKSILPLVVPTFFGFGLRGGLFIFIFRQFFMGLPTELEEAALIDGCGSFRTYFTIILPLARTTILVTAVLAMVWHWNDYFEPSIYITKASLFPLPHMLPGMYREMIQVTNMFIYNPVTGELTEKILNEGVAMAATFIVILPLMIAYLILQKQFMQGIERTGLVE
jgi:multiple sugar transport system permease protein